MSVHHEEHGDTQAREADILLRPVVEAVKSTMVTINVPAVSIESASPRGSRRHSVVGAPTTTHRLADEGRCHTQVTPSSSDKQVQWGLSVEDCAGSTHSMASTTSEVNSEDDAASIASRLSQIVSEQEFMLMDAPPKGKEQGQAAPLQKTSAQYRSASSLAVHKGAQKTLKQVRSSADVTYHEQLISESLDPGDLTPATECEQTGVSNLCLPERGNLKALESRRQQAAAARLEHESMAEKGEVMLNIRRTAWTLDEFEQTFKPTGEEQGANTTSAEAPDRSKSRRGSLSLLANEQLVKPLERKFSMNLKRNLLIRASHNVLASNSGSSNGLQTIGGSADSQEQRPSSPLDSAAVASMGHQAGHPPQSASLSRSKSVSLSIASSLDSCQSARPFSRLSNLLSPSGRRRQPNGQQSNDKGGHFNAKREPSWRRTDENQPTGDNSSACTNALKQCVPILEWLPNYKRDYLWGDLTAGLAVAVLNISLCLSAAVVAETDMGAAFRASIVNTFLYAVLCSSQHTSFGSWSIMSQMLLDCVRRALSDELILNRINLGPSASWNAEEYEMWHMNIIIMYTFLIGLFQLLGGLLNLGNTLASFIPEALCSSMIAATAFTMAIGQLANMCGTSNKILWAIEKNTTELAWADLKNPPLSITDLFAGLFRWIQQIALLIKHHQQINSICVLISFISVLLLAFNQTVLQNQLRRLFKKKNLFVPFELILLVCMVIVTYVFKLRDSPFNVTTCGPISIDFVIPNLPNLRLVRELWFDALATALISFTMVYIMSRTYSNKFNYEIDSNQELIACGAGNLVGGLFDALPATGSFSRTASQVEAGGKTQMASLVNCVALTCLAQLFGHHVAYLPVCVMSAALFFGFVRMMTRIQDALIYWRLCKVDFAIWMVTFVAILTLDLVNGFIYSFIFSILTMLYRAQNRRCYLLGSIGTSDVYVPLAKYPLARELDGIKIFQFCGPIHYVSADLFERLLRHKTRVNVKQILKDREFEASELNKTKQQNVATNNGHQAIDNNAQHHQQQQQQTPSHIILDFSMISFIDSAGVHVLKKIIVDYQQVNVTVMIASLASHVAAVVKNEPPLWGAHKDRFYVTLADAVHHALRNTNHNSTNMNQQSYHHHNQFNTGDM